MYLIKINMIDGDINIPIEKALMIPLLRNIICSEDQREYHLNRIINAGYDKMTLVSILHYFK